MSHKRCCKYTRFVDNYPQTQICLNFTRGGIIVLWTPKDIFHPNTKFLPWPSKLDYE